MYTIPYQILLITFFKNSEHHPLNPHHHWKLSMIGPPQIYGEVPLLPPQIINFNVEIIEGSTAIITIGQEAANI